jgi:hypothetical protein
MACTKKIFQFIQIPYYGEVITASLEELTSFRKTGLRWEQKDSWNVCVS